MSGLPPRLQRLIRSDVQGLHAYAIQPSNGLIKLDAMENPHRLPQRLQVELGQRLGAVPLNRYPGERIHDLRSALATYAGMPAGFDLMLGNGSDELISMIAMACDVPGAAVLAPVPGFVMYAMSARLQGLKFVGVPLTPDFELDEANMLQAIERERPSVIYLAYPNNPTANLWDDAVIDRIIAAAPGLVVLDEAYQPFSSRSYIDRIDRCGHVLLMRTLSKFGLAGVRIGYMMGPKELIAEFEKVRPPYNISVLNCEAALFALEHADVFAAQAKDVRKEREVLQRGLAGLRGVKAWHSDANMILARFPDAQRTFDGLKSRGVLVKNVSTMHSLLANCLRLTVGTSGENAQMLAALRESL
jgi:histidinol-phosphate aminotransferase